MAKMGSHKGAPSRTRQGIHLDLISSATCPELARLHGTQTHHPLA
ncbi:hypothetical protein NC651_038686 [Populus alba x Populus x berolinensis]|nr:hypothetical protein NC651_038686 [Populus alba x Populus x berolinensis]